MPGMPSCYGSEHKGRFDGEYSRYGKNFDNIDWQDMIDATTDEKKPVSGDSICGTCRGVESPLHCLRCDLFTHNHWKERMDAAGE